MLHSTIPPNRQKNRRGVLLALAAFCMWGAGCEGKLTGPGISDDVLSRLSETEVRRLSTAEYDAVIAELLYDTESTSGSVLPVDALSPFDNDYTSQTATRGLIAGLDLYAADLIAKLSSDPERLDRVVGCTPTGPADKVCFEKFITSFGRRAFRRPLTESEVSDFVELLAYGSETGDFYSAVDTALRAFLQHTSLVYRIEIGTPVAGANNVFKLNSYEMASRLSFLLWGSMPDDALLDLADKDQLSTPEQIAVAARDMFTDERVQARVDRFHALWLHYERLPHSAELAEAMRSETFALIKRVIFEEQRPWQDLFRSTETYVSDYLAEHYGLNARPGDEPAWVSYGDSGRRGLLSHGTVLSAGGDVEDTSPTLRGLFVRNRLFCQEILPPPPEVSDAVPPAMDNESPCKRDRLAVHKVGNCKGCHDEMDPIGFGLENFDQAGRFREHDNGLPQCTIDGQGELIGIGTFSGPGELADLMIRESDLNRCIATQFHRFSIGRYRLNTYDELAVDNLVDSIGQEDFRFEDLVMAVVTDPAFGYRKIAE